MDGERKKRKVENAKEVDEEEVEENEEEKMNKFFALIRSTRDLCERLFSNEEKAKEEEIKKKAADENKPPLGVWNPTFQPEDFLDGEQKPGFPLPPSGAANNQAGPSKREEDDEGGGGDGLDLKLSL